MEYKAVIETWDSKKYEYRIADSPPAQDVGELDEYSFIVRKRINKSTEATSIFIDIKSVGLRDILRVILRDTTADLGSDKPAIEQNIFYHFLPELNEYPTPDSLEDSEGSEVMAHRELLLEHLSTAFRPTLERLASYLSQRKIVFDLLWALFKPGALIYVMCPATGLPRCIRYSFGEEKTTAKGTCFEIHGHYLDFDGEVFGQSTEVLQINMFRGARHLENLPAYPLEYHPDPEIKSRLVSNGRKFISLMGSHHRQYQGDSYVLRKDRMLKYPVDGRIMVDARLFRETNPNYGRLEFKKPHVTDMFGTVLETKTVNRVRNRDMDPSQIPERDLATCSPTVLGYSLDDKFWGEFAVDKIEEIRFSTAPFDLLAIPEDKKLAIRSLTESRVNMGNEADFDDIIEGKGQGLSILLHGPPGVGKTLTAEAITELLERPLYSISSGNLSTSAGELEVQLTHIFHIASEWKAVLLLDEADVYLQHRDNVHLERNRLVATFLRTLEYYRGIFFLTTNLLEDFDPAIRDRIHLTLQYRNLDPPARVKIFNHFLNEAEASVEQCEIQEFAEVKLNGRQIKNTIKIAHDIAKWEGIKLRASHIRTALTANGYTIPANIPLSFDASLYD
ncbi:hypothetical protein LOZ65_004261 [Ophidiomyces ophidiicola]|nr:hypothetical protein LOZ65_004261 [Ophidiomyces ophidiicola]